MKFMEQKEALLILFVSVLAVLFGPVLGHDVANPWNDGVLVPTNAASCKEVSKDYCINNGTCLEPGDDEIGASGDDSRPIWKPRCNCTEGFSGDRCQTKLSCPDLPCLSSEACNYNWSKQQYECIAANTSGEPPVCKTDIQQISYHVDKDNLGKPILFLDMDLFDEDSFCFDPEDSLTYSIVQGPQEMPYLFQLVQDYHIYKTYLRINSTYKNIITEREVRVDIEAVEDSILKRKAILQLRIVFNTPPVVTYPVISWFTNTAGTMKLDIIKQARVISDTQLQLSSVELSNSIFVSAEIEDNKLKLIPKDEEFTLRRLQAVVQINDTGVPVLSTIVQLQITLIRLKCTDISVPVDINNINTRLQVGPLTCQVTPGYKLLYDLPVKDDTQFSYTLTKDNYIQLTSKTGSRSYPASLQIRSIVRVQQLPLIRSTIKIQLTFAFRNIVWFQLAAPFKEDDDDAGLPSVRVIPFRNDNWLAITLTASTNQDIAVQQLRRLVTGGSWGGLKTVPQTFQSSTGSSHIFTPTLTQDNGDMIAEGTSVTLKCSVEYINTKDTLTIQWSLNNIPMSTTFTIFQQQDIQVSTWQSESILTIHNVQRYMSGSYKCFVKDGFGASNTISKSMSIISSPLVTAPPLLFIVSGTRVSLKCQLIDDGGSPTTLQWYNDVGTLVSNSADLVITVQDSSEFKCQGSNVAGQGPSVTTKVMTYLETSETCPGATDEKNIVWKETPVGLTAQEDCYQGYTGIVTRDCSTEGVWREPNYDQCVQEALSLIQNKIAQLETGISTEPPNAIVGSLTNISQTSVLTQAETKLVVNGLKDLTLTLQSRNISSREETKQFTSSSINLVESLLDPEQNLENVVIDNTSVSLLLLDTMDRISQTLGDTLSQGDTETIASESIVLAVGKPDPFNPANISFPGDNQTTNTAVEIPADVLKSQDLSPTESLTWSIISYSNLTSLPVVISSNLTDNASTIKYQINSGVMAVNIFSSNDGLDLNNLNSDIVFTFTHLNSDLDVATCSFWDVDFNQWDNKGCTLISTNQTTSTCSCSHMTNFALLMKPTKVELKDAAILSNITVIGCSISIFCLLLTVFIYAFVWRYVKSDRAVVLVNLCIALIIALILFLFGIDRTYNYALCTTIAVCLHYFYLVVFFLMLAEGFEVLVSIVKIVSSRSKLRELLIMGWGIPIVIVAISLATTRLQGYGNKNFCWLSIDGGLIYAFVAPAAVVILINFIIVIKIIYSLLNTRVMINREIKDKAKAALRSICVLLPVMGLGWVFGILAVNEDLVIFDYIFTILNTLQGLFIFIFHCIINRKVREGLASRRRRYRSRHTDLSGRTGSKTEKNRNSQKAGDYGNVFTDDKPGQAEGIDMIKRRSGPVDTDVFTDIPQKRPVERLKYPDHEPSAPVGGYLSHFPELSEGYSNLSTSEDPTPIYPNTELVPTDLNQELFKPALLRGNSILSGGFSDRSGSLNSDELGGFAGLPRPKLYF